LNRKAIAGEFFGRTELLKGGWRDGASTLLHATRRVPRR
jgi:hypothetical protein